MDWASYARREPHRRILASPPGCAISVASSYDCDPSADPVTFLFGTSVPLPKAADDDEQLGMLQKWLESYGPTELFNTDNATDKTELDQSNLPSEVINGKALRIIPRKEFRRMGFNKVRLFARALLARNLY